MEEKFKFELELSQKLIKGPCLKFLKDVCKNADSENKPRTAVLNFAITEIAEFLKKYDIQKMDLGEENGENQD